MAYDVETWAKAKADYESGNFSVEKLGKKWGISDTQIENKIAKEGWVKGKNAPLIQQSIADKNIEAFAKANCTHKDIVDKMVAVILSDDDNRLRLSYIQEYNKMCGTLAPSKKEVTGEGGKDLIPNMTKEQLLEKLRNITG